MTIERRKSQTVPDDEADAHIQRNVFRQTGQVEAADRARMLGQHPATVWLTGLPGSGKTTLAYSLERRLVDAGHACFVLDGDNLRRGLTRDLTFTPGGRRENVRRAAETARLMNDAGLIAIVALVSPYGEDREMARRIIDAARFIEAYLSAGAEVCEKRDAKGLYAKARRGEILNFTGVNAPYEVPTEPDIVIDTAADAPEPCLDRLCPLVFRHIALR